MKNRGSLNLVIEAVMFLVLACIAGMGFLMKYTLPPGREKILEYGENVQLYFLGMDRHQWGSIHLIAAYILLGLLVLHIALHWKAIVALLGNAVPAHLLRSTLATIFVLLCAVGFTFAFFVVPTRKEGGEYLYRNTGSRAFEKPTDMHQSEERLDGKDVVAEKGREHPGGERATRQTGEPPAPGSVERAQAAIRGSMTVAEVAKTCGISADEVKRRLGLPAHVEEGETLGRLRKIYGFTMQQVRERLEKDRR
jgi:hypothetical protein